MYSKGFIVVLFLTTLLLVGCESSVKDGLPYEEYIKMVQTYLNDGDYDRAIAAGKKAASIRPTDGETHYFLATQYHDSYVKSSDAANMKLIQDALLNHNKRRNLDPVEEAKKFGLKPELESLALQEFK